MTQITAPKHYVFTSSQIAARRKAFASDCFIYNTTTKGVRLGPGFWSDCTVLVPDSAGGSGGTTALDISSSPFIFVLAGSGSGAYRDNGAMASGYKAWELVGGPGSNGNEQTSIIWDGYVMAITNSIGQALYVSDVMDAPIDPVLVPGWYKAEGALDPLPILRRVTATTVQTALEELAKFTLMPIP